ncbi:hypothetical protein TNCV_1324541 [Trichonephila clavipes]|nr:hypothetical protein TNCV_1324541 [Trichonephila clavipes]
MGLVGKKNIAPFISPPVHMLCSYLGVSEPLTLNNDLHWALLPVYDLVLVFGLHFQSQKTVPDLEIPLCDTQMACATSA